MNENTNQEEQERTATITATTAIEQQRQRTRLTAVAGIATATTIKDKTTGNSWNNNKWQKTISSNRNSSNHSSSTDTYKTFFKNSACTRRLAQRDLWKTSKKKEKESCVTTLTRLLFKLLVQMRVWHVISLLGRAQQLAWASQTTSKGSRVWMACEVFTQGGRRDKNEGGQPTQPWGTRQARGWKRGCLCRYRREHLFPAVRGRAVRGCNHTPQLEDADEMLLPLETCHW